MGIKLLTANRTGKKDKNSLKIREIHFLIKTSSLVSFLYIALKAYR